MERYSNKAVTSAFAIPRRLWKKADQRNSVELFVIVYRWTSVRNKPLIIALTSTCSLTRIHLVHDPEGWTHVYLCANCSKAYNRDHSCGRPKILHTHQSTQTRHQQAQDCQYPTLLIEYPHDVLREHCSSDYRNEHRSRLDELSLYHSEYRRLSIFRHRTFLSRWQWYYHIAMSALCTYHLQANGHRQIRFCGKHECGTHRYGRLISVYSSCFNAI